MSVFQLGALGLDALLELIRRVERQHRDAVEQRALLAAGGGVQME